MKLIDEDDRAQDEIIASIVLRHYPDVQAVYLFGSHGTPDQRPNSDVDIALLLPPSLHQTSTALMVSDCRVALEDALKRPVDLVSAREVSTVFQKEVIELGRPILCRDKDAAVEFEFMTLSLYQKLNEERADILKDFTRDGRISSV